MFPLRARRVQVVATLSTGDSRAELLEQQTRASDRNEERDSDQPGDTAAPGRTGAARADEWEPSPEERRQHPARSENEPKKR
jgi:hypothetical protein